MPAHSRSTHVLHRLQHIHTMALSSPYTSPQFARWASLSVLLEIVSLVNPPLKSVTAQRFLPSVLSFSFVLPLSSFSSFSFPTLLCSLSSFFCTSFSFSSFSVPCLSFLFSLQPLCSFSCSLQCFRLLWFQAPASHHHQKCMLLCCLGLVSFLPS